MDKKKLIYIVDDDQFINTLVVKRFNSEDYDVVAFETGEECLDALEKNPDLIILDYLFTGKSRIFSDGMQIFEKIRQLKPQIPVILLSGQEKGEVVLEFARKGVFDYIVKDNNLIDNLAVSIKEVFSREV
jgi:DNA-binding NtrC family response regulator